MKRARKLLVMNQYPPTFFEPIINSTLTKIIQSTTEINEDDENTSLLGSDLWLMVQWMMVPSLFLFYNIEEKDKFRLFVQYRGKCTEQYARALHNIQAPCRVIMTLRKLMTVLPPLKPHVEWSMRSDVIYQITCPRCQVRYVI